MSTLAHLLLAAAGMFTASAGAAEACPYLADFVRLQPTLSKMEPAQAARALERYAASHENPQACEGFEIDRRLDSLEPQFFAWVQGSRRLPAQAVYRCDVFDNVTAQCRSPMADDTAHMLESGLTPLAKSVAAPFDVSSRRKGASLLGVYVVSMEDAMEGRPATRLFRHNRRFGVPALSGDLAVMAIFKTDGPWRFRKAVWYLR